MKLKLLATAISSTLLIGCGSDDSLPKVTEGTYYNATPLTIGEFTTVTINSGEQLEAFKVTVPSTGSNRTITTVIDIVEPTPYAEFWYQDKSVLFGQLMPEQDIHDAVNRDDADPDSLLYISEAFRTPFLEPQDTIIEQAFATFDDEGVAQPFSTTDETFYFYVRSPEYSIQPTLTNAIESLSYPLELRVGVFEQSQDAFCSDEEDGIQCITEAPHENYHCGLIDGQGELGACEGIVTFEPVSAISGKDTVSVVEQWPNASETNMAVFSGNGTVGLDPVWMVNNFPENAQFYLSSNNSPEVTFYADTVGEYEITLTVINEIGRPSTATHLINVVADSDGDGIVDGEDPDADGDGYVGAEDLFPNDKASHRDSDGDGVSNYAQEDEDGDGIVDYLDAYPFDAQRSELDIYAEPVNESFTNDGITIAEETGLSVPLSVTGEFNDEVGIDQDFYAINIPSGRITVNVDTGGILTPNVAILKEDGTPLPSILLTDSAGTYDASITSLVEDSNTYYLYLRGKPNTKTPYSVSINFDSDQDGIADNIEIALDSNELNPDSDGDQVPDGIELSFVKASNHDTDGDSIPAWWDLDSDGDGLPDSFESQSQYPQNTDADELNNSIDIDSDGNGLLDRDEIGPNLLSPVDSDSDGIPDVYDMDNDNDGLTDDIDTDMYNRVAVEPDPLFDENAFGIRAINYIEYPNALRCPVGSSIDLDVVNIPNTSDLSVYTSINFEVHELPYEIVEGKLRIECTGAMVGYTDLFVRSGNMVSVKYAVNVVPIDSLIISEAKLRSGRLELSGTGLNRPYTLVFGDYRQTITNDSNEPSDFDSVTVGADFRGGYGYIETSSGRTDKFYLKSYEKSATVIVNDFPFNTSDDLIVETNDGKEYSVNSDGRVNVNFSDVDAKRIYVFEIATDADGNDTRNWIGGGISAPWMNELTLSPATLALSLFTDFLAIDLANPDNRQVYETLLSLPEVEALGSQIMSELASNKDYLVQLDLYATDAYIAANNAIQETINPEISNSLNGDFEFEPGTVDDIAVVARNGNVVIDNDSQTYLSTYSIASKSDPSEPDVPLSQHRHASGHYDSSMVSPKFGFFAVAKEATAYEQSPQPSKVTIVTPGFDTSFTPQRGRSGMDVFERRGHYYTQMRTVTDEIVVPLATALIVDILDVDSLPPSIMRELFIQNAWFGLNETIETGNGQSANSLINDILDQILAVLQSPSFIDAVVEKANLNETFIAKKIAVRAVPYIGWVKLAWDAAQGAETAFPVIRALNDFSEQDMVLEFTYQPPLQLDSIQPNTVSPLGLSKVFELNGVGFNTQEKGFIFKDVYRPNILVENPEKDISYSVVINNVFDYGNRANVQLPGSLFEENITYDVSFFFEYENGETLFSNVIEDGIKVSSELIIDSLSSTEAYPSQTISIKGSGFNLDQRLNRVIIGDKILLPLAGDRNELLVYVPDDIDNGSYDLYVETLDSDGNVLMTSNIVELTIANSETVIEVCDSGSAKDDNFALTVNGRPYGSTNTTRFNYCTSFNVSLNVGENVVELDGVEAPDGIGTYTIYFPVNLRIVEGDPLTGTDLVPNSPSKVWTVILDSADPTPLTYSKSLRSVEHIE